MSEPTSVPGTCDQWASDSSLAVGKEGYWGYQLQLPTISAGLASKIGEPASHILAPHRVHCNKRLIVICVETPSSGGGASKRSRRSSQEESLLSFSQYRDELHQLQLQSMNDL